MGLIVTFFFLFPSAHLVNSEKEKSLNAKLVHDGQEYVARAGLGVSKSGNKVRYEPIFEYKAPEATRSALIGKKGGPKQKQQAVSCGGMFFIYYCSLTREKIIIYIYTYINILLFFFLGYIIEEVNGKTHSYKIHDLAITTPRTTYLIAGMFIYLLITFFFY